LRRRRGPLACALAALAVLAGCAQKAPIQSFADLPRHIRQGHTVYVTDAEGEETRGRVQEVSPSALILLARDGTTTRFSAEGVKAVDRYGDPIWNGLGIGLGVGTGMALLADPRERPCPDGRPGVCRDAEVASRLAAVAVFGAAGAALDALIRRRTPVYLAPDGARASRLVIAPTLSSRGMAVVLSVSF
jgi:hypothetical protein